MRHILLWGLNCLVFLGAAAGCRHPARVPAVPAAASDEFVDLNPGGSLRVLVPLYAGEPVISDEASRPEANGNHGITLSAPNLLGYRVVRYKLQGEANGRVRLHLMGSETTLDGRTKVDRQTPPLPFPLPKGAQYTRLIYLVRISTSDHNMAIVAARRRDLLDEATTQVKADPKACVSNHAIFCAWVPSRISVRPETPPLSASKENLRDR